jgi:hypothetical protein
VGRPPHRIFTCARRTSAVVIAALALALPAHADRPAAPDPGPRHLALSEALPAAAIEALPSLHVALSAALQPVAERMAALDNPYAVGAAAPGDGLPECCRSFPSSVVEATPEDPNDIMGITLGRGAMLGLHVDLVGPIEMRETYTRLTNPRVDPTDLRYIQGSLGLRLGF